MHLIKLIKILPLSFLTFKCWYGDECGVVVNGRED